MLLQINYLAPTSNFFKPLAHRAVTAHTWRVLRGGQLGPGQGDSQVAATEKIYRRTEAGLKVWESRNVGLPVECRRILGMVADDTHSEAIRAVLRSFSDAQIDNWLAQLESLRLLESSPAEPERDLDFTGNFKISELFGKR
jgi:hypothetical protein